MLSEKDAFFNTSKRSERLHCAAFRGSQKQDVLRFLETKGKMNTANELAKVVAKILKVVGLSKGEASQSSETFYKPLEAVVIVKVL